MTNHKKVIASIPLCPLARECKNNVCVLRAEKVYGYPITPSTKQEQEKAIEIEKKIGRTYFPYLETQLRNGKVNVICPDFME